MTAHIDNDELRAIRPFLKLALNRWEVVAKEHPDMLDGFNVLDALYSDSIHAEHAKPDCEVCKGSGQVTLFPAGGDPDDPPDYEERTCPACRPWPQGFNGWRETVRTSVGLPMLVWKVAPYGPGESVDTVREVRQP